MLYGWTPRTFYTYDEQGRVASTWTESVWDDHERALVDAWQDWRNSLHKCGIPRSQSFKVDGFPSAEDFAVPHFECAACEALEIEQARLAKADEKQHEKGIHPSAWRELQVMPMADALELQRQQNN